MSKEYYQVVIEHLWLSERVGPEPLLYHFLSGCNLSCYLRFLILNFPLIIENLKCHLPHWVVRTICILRVAMKMKIDGRVIH